MFWTAALNIHYHLPAMDNLMPASQPPSSYSDIPLGRSNTTTHNNATMYYLEKPLARSDTTSTYSTMSERTRSTPLSRMLLSGEVSGEAPRGLNVKERFERWMVNEGSRRFVVALFVLVHGMVFGFGFMNYYLKDNLTNARATFGITYPIARAAALVLHFDIALILFPVCRTLISLLRQTPLNGIIAFDKNLTFPQARRILYRVLHLAPHHCALEQFCSTRLENEAGLRRLPQVELRHGPWLVWICHALRLDGDAGYLA